MLPEALIGHTHNGSYLCRDWELRVTRRCLVEDLEVDVDSSFEDLLGIAIIKAFVKKRAQRTDDTRQVSPLTCGKPVWVLARGSDHRAGTLFDEAERVVWLVAYRRHRSGAADDFFPYCKALDTEGKLLPDAPDYEGLLRDRDVRFAFAIRIEAPLILKKARTSGIEQRATIGGSYGVCVALEAADDLEAISVAFKAGTVPRDYIPIVLAAFKAGHWDAAYSMPSRELQQDECAFTYLGRSGGLSSSP